MKVTIGIAVYQVERYLQACLDSVARFEGEILIVDDGSTDRSGQICDQFAPTQKNVRVIHQKNAGVSAVRNLIIQEATGEWICFLDGDDMLCQDFGVRIKEHADSSFDLIYFDWQFFMYEHAISKYTTRPGFEILEGEDILNLAQGTMYSAKDSRDFQIGTIRSVCGKLIRKSFLINHQLELSRELLYGEDVLFNLHCLARAKRVKLVRCPFYLYRQNPGSAVNRYQPNILDCNTKLADELEKFSKQFPGEMEKRFQLRCVADLGAVLRLDLCHPDNPKPVSVRRQEFEQLQQLDWCGMAFSLTQRERLTPKHRQIFDVFVTRDFDHIMVYYKKEIGRKKIKQLANQIGLTKLLKPLRDHLRKR